MTTELTINYEISESAKENIQKYMDKNHNGKYLIISEENRMDEVKEYINDTLWAFDTDFILQNTKSEIIIGLSNYEYSQLDTSLKSIQESLCEGANTIIKCLLEDFNDFCDEAVRVDGFGHFLSSYDGEEIELGNYFGDSVEYYAYKLG